MDYAAVYREIHETKPKEYAGLTVRRHIETIAELIATTGAKRLLDYGSGKGYQYLVHRVHEKWGGLLPYCYDVGVRQLAGRPEGKFDGIICTDVLEHIEEQDLFGFFSDVFGLMSDNAFVLFAVSCAPSKMQLPDGRNAHVTIRPPAWWRALIGVYAKPGRKIVTAFDVEG